MKKIIVAALMALMLVPVFAGKIEKAWNFTVNDEGECIVERSFNTSKDGVAALKAFKNALNKQTFENRSTISEVAGESIVYELKKNTKSRYNPFAGNFNEAMQFQMEVRYSDGKVSVSLYDFTLENKYEGFGKNTKNETFAGKIAEYEEAEEAAANAKGKEKKEHEEVMENISDSFNTCQEELEKMFAAFEKALQ